MLIDRPTRSSFPWLHKIFRPSFPIWAAIQRIQIKWPATLAGPPAREMGLTDSADVAAGNGIHEAQSAFIIPSLHYLEKSLVAK